MLTMNCSNCGEPLKTLTHQTDIFQYQCPQCKHCLFDYRDPTGMDKVAFKKHFESARRNQFKNLQRLFPHSKPKDKASSTFAANLLFDTIYKSLVKELYRTNVPENMVE